jgi:hypothetical protein
MTDTPDQDQHQPHGRLHTAWDGDGPPVQRYRVSIRGLRGTHADGTPAGSATPVEQAPVESDASSARKEREAPSGVIHISPPGHPDHAAAKHAAAVARARARVEAGAGDDEDRALLRASKPGTGTTHDEDERAQHDLADALAAAAEDEAETQEGQAST